MLHISHFNYRSSFEIINTGDNPNKNKSPVIHVDTHLGLESWCVQHVYQHAHKIILSVASSSSSSNWIVLEQNTPHCNPSTKQLQNNQHASYNIIKYLNCAILINPDVTTFWNFRRRLFQKNRLNISREFQFSSIVLTKKPKSNDAFNYRRWLYSFQSHESIDWNRELALCERCASKSLSNYHAWCHRQWILQKAPDLLIYELRFTEKFIRKHIGDYSGYHYRQIVLRKLFEFSYLELKPCVDDTEYTALAKYISEIGINNVLDIKSSTDLIKIVVPQVADNDLENEDDKTKVKSFLFCLNVAAYDLQMVIELTDMFGYREAFEYHRKATLKLVVDACNEFRTGNWLSHREQPLKKIMKTSGMEKPDKFLTAIQRYEGINGSEKHRKWCELFLGFKY